MENFLHCGLKKKKKGCLQSQDVCLSVCLCVSLLKSTQTSHPALTHSKKDREQESI